MWLSEQSRLLTLILGCALLWSLESFVPLYHYDKRRLFRAGPNIGLAIVLVITNLALAFSTTGVARLVESREVGLSNLMGAPVWLRALLAILALDLAAYVAHVLLHKSSYAWQFHRVHHSDKEVNVTTAFRQHPGETMWRILWQVIAVAVFAIPLWALFLYLTLSALQAQLEHSNIRVNERVDRIAKWLVVTPGMHKIHHSREQIETDSNYSNIFSIWDRLFGTFTSSVNFNRLRYGLDGFDGRKIQTLMGLLRLPFRP
jgi:sterol desaturase/sphingolipid hydroxylase (fatty acid hydroxylase superfamily)